MARLRVLGENPPSPKGSGEDQLRDLRVYLTRLKDELEFLLTHLGEDNLDGDLTEHIRQIQTNTGKITTLEGDVSDLNTALAGKQDTLTFDLEPTMGSDNPVKSKGLFWALMNKQDTLTFDNAPANGSGNPVKSGGIYAALQGKDDADRFIVMDTGNVTLASQTWDSYTGVYAILMPLSSRPNGYRPVAATINRWSNWKPEANLKPFVSASNGNVYLLSEIDATTLGTSAKAGLRVLLEKD